jgi:hypothetical protein
VIDVTMLPSKRQLRLPWTLGCGQGLDDEQRRPGLSLDRSEAPCDQAAARWNGDNDVVVLTIDEWRMLPFDRRRDDSRDPVHERHQVLR